MPLHNHASPAPRLAVAPEPTPGPLASQSCPRERASPLKPSELLALLARGAPHSYFWYKDGKRSQWYPASAIPRPDQWRDVYFGVHPCGAIPPGDRAHVRGQKAYVGAVNGMYADLDFDQFDGGEAAARAHVEGLKTADTGPSPNVIVSSGGGFHLYWLLDEPVVFTAMGANDEARDAVARLQSKWVRLLGGDPAASDLARILRVPGSWNGKYDPPRRVEILYADLSSVYRLPDICALASAVPLEGERDSIRPPRAPAAGRATGRRSVIDAYNRATPIRDLLVYYGYTIRGDTFTRPGKLARDGISGTLRERENDCYTFSSNDPAYDASATSRSGAGCTLKPFDLLCRLSFGGDARAAVRHLHEVAT